MHGQRMLHYRDTQVLRTKIFWRAAILQAIQRKRFMPILSFHLLASRGSMHCQIKAVALALMSIHKRRLQQRSPRMPRCPLCALQLPIFH
jgi:hypothetical protein